MINRVKGFTLIELMVVVAIIGIISAIAYPSYQTYMLRSRRSDAKTGLTQVASREERYFSQCNCYTYTSDLTQLGYSASPANSDEGYYQLSVTPPNGGTLATGYVVTADATAVAGSKQGGDTTTPDGDCRVMTLDSTGVKTPAACW